MRRNRNMTDIEAEVDRLFREIPGRTGDQQENPVTGESWLRGLDPVRPHKRRACRALAARERFAKNGPPDAPVLPLSYGERESLKTLTCEKCEGDKCEQCTLAHIVAWYARSLEAQDYDVDNHPSFEEYARGVFASTHAPTFLLRNEELRKRYPPKALPGLGSGLYWEPGRRK